MNQSIPLTLNFLFRYFEFTFKHFHKSLVITKIGRINQILHPLIFILRIAKIGFIKYQELIIRNIQLYTLFFNFSQSLHSVNWKITGFKMSIYLTHSYKNILMTLNKYVNIAYKYFIKLYQVYESQNIL